VTNELKARELCTWAALRPIKDCFAPNRAHRMNLEHMIVSPGLRLIHPSDVNRLDSQAKRGKHRAPGPRQQRLYLQAPSLAVQTPFAEVLAIVCQKTIAVFAHSGSSAAENFPDIEI
jgi:hypothetical protein